MKHFMRILFAVILTAIAPGLTSVASARSDYNGYDDRGLKSVLEHPRTDHQCLIQMAYRETRGADKVDKITVSWLALSRAESGKFPPTPCKVVHQKHVKRGHVWCEYPWSCKPTTIRKVDPQAFTEVAEAVDKAESLNAKYGPIPALFFNQTHSCNAKYSHLYMRTRYMTYCSPGGVHVHKSSHVSRHKSTHRHRKHIT